MSTEVQLVPIAEVIIIAAAEIWAGAVRIVVIPSGFMALATVFIKNSPV